MLKLSGSLRVLPVAAAAALACPLAAAANAAPPETAAWLAAHTDLNPAQVVIAGPDHVYTLEVLGQPTPSGEVVALVRAETVDKTLSAKNGFASWDAHLLFDCPGGRLRTLRSAVYPRQNRKGVPRTEATIGGWSRPEAPEPAARLFAAACDGAFEWPFRVAAASPPAAAPPAPPVLARPVLAVAPQPQIQPPTPSRTPPATTAVALPYAVQLGRGPSEEGARRALKAARKVLGDAAAALADATEVDTLTGVRRYTVRLTGFVDEGAAKGACRTLLQAGQDCFPWQAPPPPAPPVPGAPLYAIQVAHGPSEEGAQRALKAARKVLGSAAAGLTGAMRFSQVPAGDRYTAVLGGFRSAEEASRACAALIRAGQTCFALRQDDDVA
jgi:hypothetical protein